MPHFEQQVAGREPSHDCTAKLAELHSVGAALLDSLRNSADDEQVEELVLRHSRGLALLQQLADSQPETFSGAEATELLGQAVANVDEICALLQQQLRLLGNELQSCSNLRRTLREVADSDTAAGQSGFSLIG